jgi:hypothetical protein
VRRWWRYGQLLQPFVVEIQSAGGMVPRQPGLQRTTAQSALSWHLTSHAHAWPQLTSPPHARLPLQLTLQVIVHDAAPPQLTPLLHWLLAEHRTLQFQPAGQLTARLQTSLLSEQSTVQTFWAVLHDVHCDGHTAPESAAITQNPSTQLRPSAQRCSALQAKSVLRWLTEQPAASARATAIQSAGFTASLRR